MRASQIRRARRFLPLVLAVFFSLSCRKNDPVRELDRFPAPVVPVATKSKPKAWKRPPISDEQRTKGYGECNPPDPLGLGPYSMYRPLYMGRMLVPQKGGHTEDMGYDVLVHFHGSEAVRKLLVPVARGIVLVLIDKGNGGGPYSRALTSPAAFPELRKSIEAELKHASGDERAHIRHLAVSAWSAGEVAIDHILQQHQPGIDAYVILDGLHSAWKRGARHVPELDSLEVAFVAHAVELAKRAQRGETIFVLTHSSVDPMTYPSTTLSANLLLRELALKADNENPGEDPFGQISSVDVAGLHVWGFRGKNEAAHCAELFLILRVVCEMLEPAWDTPPMDRSVPPTPLPDWQKRAR